MDVVSLILELTKSMGYGLLIGATLFVILGSVIRNREDKKWKDRLGRLDSAGYACTITGIIAFGIGLAADIITGWPVRLILPAFRLRILCTVFAIEFYGAAFFTRRRAGTSLWDFGRITLFYLILTILGAMTVMISFPIVAERAISWLEAMGLPLLI